ncbi:vacuolar protein sorting protein VPS10, partial [Acrasis kona]
NFSVILILSLVLVVLSNPITFTTTLDGTIDEIVWVNKDVGFLRTHSHAYITLDVGKTITSINDKLCGTSGCARIFVVSEANTDVIMIRGKNAEENWLVTGLNNKSPVYTKAKIADKSKVIKELRWHPRAQSIAALVNTPKNKIRHDLYISKDGGKSWSQDRIMADVNDFVFGNLNSKNFKEEMLYAVHDTDDGASLVEFNFNTLEASNSKIENALGVANVGNFMFATTPEHMYVSGDNADTFNAVKLSKKLKGGRFTVLDASEGSVFLNALPPLKKNIPNPPYGDLYLSDATGTRYSLSLSGNRRESDFCDFQKIKSLEGVYIANAAAPSVKDTKECKECKTKEDCFKYCQYHSAITFDKGGVWTPLVGPEKDIHNKVIKCKNHIDGTGGKKLCPLQLHSVLSDASQIHSHKDAIGLILATGNIGGQLQKDESDVNTYLSRDGGFSWVEVGKGSHAYEFTNRGELIVKVTNKQPSHSIDYSVNYGKTFEKFKFSNHSSDDILFKRIHHPGDPQSRTILIDGVRDRNTVLLTVDFSTLNLPDCKLHENPSDANSDYEIFRPHTYGDQQCLMGRQVDYTRRKADRTCLSPSSVDFTPSNVRNCACTKRDYTCDLYYKRDYKESQGSDLVCKPVKDDQETINKIPDPCNGYYTRTQGYLKVAGDTCEGGLDLNPVLIKCPSGISVFGVILLLFFLFILLSFTTIYLYKNTTFLQTFVNGPANFVSYNQVTQQEEFGLSDNEDDSEPDEIEESSFSNYKSGQEAPDDFDDFKTESLEPIDAEEPSASNTRRKHIN